ncbi:VanZ family protein [Aeoliella sp.]|uniref:VanZ family protein n=1 Tax=Aeoliella sp. TaxID=2795800 RepID=UPI003CCBBE80
MAAPPEGDEPIHPPWYRWRWAMLAAYWLVMLAATHRPAKPTPGAPPATHIDKPAHAVGFAILAWMLAWCWCAGLPLTFRRAAIILGVLLAYSVLDELTQPWFARTCDPLDLLADLVGAAIGLGAFALMSRRRERAQT